MPVSQKGIDLIKEFEKMKSVAYKPTPYDRWTVGYGVTFYSNGAAVKEGDTLTQEQAEELLEYHLNDILKKLGAIPKNVTQNQLDAVVSLVYNIGVTAFLTSETGKLFKQGKDISHKFDKWIYQNGSQLKGLVRRRKAEKELYMAPDVV